MHTKKSLPLIAAIALLATLLVLPAWAQDKAPVGTVSSDAIFLPHGTVGKMPWNNYLEVDNLDKTNPAGFTLMLIDENDALYSEAITVPANSYTAIDLKDKEADYTLGVIDPDNEELLFRAAYEFANSGRMASFDLSDDTGSSLAFLFSNFPDFVQWKGLAIMNASDTAVTVTLEAYGNQQLQDSTSLTIGAWSRVAGVHTDWFNVDVDDVERIDAVGPDGAKLTGISLVGNNGLSKMLFTPAKITETPTTP
jgi:hypothetical protein